MANLTSLEDMVLAIAGSIMNAQHMVEKAQVANIASFFTDDKQPTTIELKLPAVHSTAKPGDMLHYRLPLLSLVPHSSLIIGEAEIDLDMELGAFEEQDRSGHNESIMSQTGMAAPAGRKAGLMVSPASANNGSRDRNIAHIKLKLQATEKSDGLARLLNDVVKEQGPTGLVQE
ncbi:DUF2589 domain-containing protein [Collimonas sp. H4R21]|jgi:hypothetical protein|uniref:DUF2589 domain-containing protein n=1 Tax=Collimonas rhizosphaerae TaxID=3126357 RepID=A0ABU9PQB9_9BURK|nr:DUF2589 domain-containing protein [Collimonas sp. OK412]SFB73123.1 Protein of unknown function [Collimonas sp. OK412]